MPTEHLSAPQVTDSGPDSLVSGAILRTLIYADIFDFPMRLEEIQHFLIGCTTSLDAVRAALESSAWLAGRIERAGGYYHLRGRAALVALRHEREKAAQRLWPVAMRYGGWLAHLPFVRMAALTGSLAMRNPRGEHDDIDYLLITAPRRVWLARAFAIVVVRLARLRRIGLCPNYVLAETALEQSQHNLYMAHEMAQMVPIRGAAHFAAMNAANPWAAIYLPNARAPFYDDADPAREESPRRVGRFAQRLGEWLFGGWRGDALDAWEQRRKIRRFRRFQAEAGGHPGAAHLDGEHVKGHFQDHGQRILARYAEGLRAHGLADEGVEWRAAGWASPPSTTPSGAPVPVGAPFQPVAQ
ncbi:MAG: hypothetical protein IT323_02555 [Anaerolineae bacterium]|nr:hypothetical protein [Anaerolineae bacterium]